MWPLLRRPLLAAPPLAAALAMLQTLQRLARLRRTRRPGRLDGLSDHLLRDIGLEPPVRTGAGRRPHRAGE